MKKIKGIGFFLIALLQVNIMSGATITSKKTGIWNQRSTWNGGTVPGIADSVVISNGHIVSLTTITSVRSLTLNNGHIAGTSILNIMNQLGVGNGSSLGNSADITVGQNFIAGNALIGNIGGTVSGRLIVHGAIIANFGNEKLSIFKKELIANGAFDWGCLIELRFGGKITISNTGTLRSLLNTPTITGSGIVDIKGSFLQETGSNVIFSKGVITNISGNFKLQDTVKILGGGTQTGSFADNTNIFGARPSLFLSGVQLFNPSIYAIHNIELIDTAAVTISKRTKLGSVLLLNKSKIEGNFTIECENINIINGTVKTDSVITTSFAFAEGLIDGFDPQDVLLIKGKGLINSLNPKTIKNKKINILDTTRITGSTVLLNNASIIIHPLAIFMNTATSTISNITGFGTVVNLGTIANESNQSLQFDAGVLITNGTGAKIIQGPTPAFTGIINLSDFTLNQGELQINTGIVNIGGNSEWKEGAFSSGNGILKTFGAHISVIAPGVTFSNIEIGEGAQLTSETFLTYNNLILNGGMIITKNKGRVFNDFYFKAGTLGDSTVTAPDSFFVYNMILNQNFERKVFNKNIVVDQFFDWSLGEFKLFLSELIIKGKATINLGQGVSKSMSLGATNTFGSIHNKSEFILQSGTITGLTKFNNVGQVSGQGTIQSLVFQQIGIIAPHNLISVINLKIDSLQSRIVCLFNGTGTPGTLTGPSLLENTNSIAELKGTISINNISNTFPGLGVPFQVFKSLSGYTGTFNSVTWTGFQSGFGFILTHEPTQVTATYCRVRYRDADGDGFGSKTDSIVSCSSVAGYVNSSTDCDDTNFDVNPGAREECDGIDNDCNGVIDDGCARGSLEQRTSSPDVFPNPTPGIVTIDTKIFMNEKTHLEILDLHGNVLHKNSINSTSSSIQYHLKQNINLSSGNYIIRLSSAARQKSYKISVF